MKKPIRIVGLDAHKDSISVAEDGGGGEVRYLGTIGTTAAALTKLVTRTTICNAGGLTGFLKPGIGLFKNPPAFEKGATVLPRYDHPEIDRDVLARVDRSRRGQAATAGAAARRALRLGRTGRHPDAPTHGMPRQAVARALYGRRRMRGLGAEKTLFLRRWYGGMISARLEVMWEMSDKLPEGGGAAFSQVTILANVKIMHAGIITGE